jgi:hypothetical protein
VLECLKGGDKKENKLPSIKESQNADLSGYIPSLGPVAPEHLGVQRPRANPMIRCPLPPFGADPDDLRQFETGQVPQIRVIPLPDPATIPAPPTKTVAAPTSAATPSFIEVTNIVNLSVDAAISKLALASTPVSVNFSTGVILAGASFLTSVTMAKSFQLLSLIADQLCAVRIYGTADSQTFDNARPIDAPVAPELSNLIVTSIIFDTLPYAWGWAGRMGSNQDVTRSSTIYVSVFNTDVVDVSNINVSISYLPLES